MKEKQSLTLDYNKKNVMIEMLTSLVYVKGIPRQM